MREFQSRVEKNGRPWMTAFALLVVIVWCALDLRNASFAIWIVRDLRRASLWLQGQPLISGPELSMGGSLPGPLYYWLLAIPAHFQFGWRALAAFCYSFTAGAALVIFSFARKRWGLGTAWIALGALLASTNVRLNMIYMANPQVMILFHTLVLVGLVAVFAESFGKRDLVWNATCLCCALSLQVHMSGLYLVPCAVVLQLASRRYGLTPLSRRQVLRGPGIFLAPLGAYALWKLIASGFSWRESRLFLWDLLQRWTQVRYASGGGAYGGGHARLLTFLKEYLSLQFVVDPAILYLAISMAGFAAIRRTWFPTHTQLRPDWKKETRILLLCSIVLGVLTIPANLQYSEIKIRTRYILTFDLALLLLLAVLFAESARKAFGSLERSVRIAFAACVGVSALLVGATVGFRTESFGRRLHVTADESERISRVVVAQTGWRADRFVRSLFLVNGRFHQDFWFVYQATGRNVIARAPIPAGSRPDGYFLVGRDARAPELSWRQQLVQSPLPGELQQALATGKLELREEFVGRSFTLASYRILDPLSLPTEFGNLGQPYAESDIVTSPLPAPRGTLKLEGGRTLFYFPSCADAGALGAGVVLRPEEAPLGMLRIEATVLGKAISNASWRFSPQCATDLFAPYVEVDCDGRRERAALASVVGASFPGVGPPESRFVAPLSRRLEFPCRHLTEVSVGYESGASYVRERYASLPPEKVSYRVARTEPSWILRAARRAPPVSIESRSKTAE